VASWQLICFDTLGKRPVCMTWTVSYF